MIGEFQLTMMTGLNNVCRCYVRAAYCDNGSDKGDMNSWTVVLTERLEGAVNLGDAAVRSLKQAGIPEGSSIQVRCPSLSTFGYIS
jgi:hypothetical protein